MDLDKPADSLSFNFTFHLNLNLSLQSRPFSDSIFSLYPPSILKFGYILRDPMREIDSHWGGVLVLFLICSSYHLKVKKKERIVFLSSYLVLFLFFVNPTDEKSNNWQKWLDEVDLIITKAERAVFKTLKTEEDRTRFQASFWKIRDNNPNSPENEYKIEFYKRLNHADLNLGGTNSDRARIYILLGEPFEEKKYVGNEQIVDCELWSYKGGGRPGLPHHMYLIFFKNRNVGTYKIFHPGPQTAWDILSPGYQSNITSISQSYRLLRSYFPELARATLSIIPEEGDSMRGTSLSSSGYVLTQIFQLPEKEVDNNYLRDFTSLDGVVDISYSTKAIGGERRYIDKSEQRN